MSEKQLNNPKNFDVSGLSEWQVKFLLDNNIEIRSIDENNNVNCMNFGIFRDHAITFDNAGD